MSTAKVTKFELMGADGGPLVGEVRTVGDGTGRPPVVICHGFRGCKDWDFIPVLVERLARAGMTAVSFNFSGSGVDDSGNGFTDRERFAHSTFSNDVNDIGIVCRSLKEGKLVAGLTRSNTYGLFGYSRGGGAAILHTADNPAVRSLVTWSAISHTSRWDEDTVTRWRSEGRRVFPDAGGGEDLFIYTDMLDDIEKSGRALDITYAAGRIEAPWLIMHGEADDFVPLREGEELHSSANSANLELSVVKGATHSFGVLDGPGRDTKQLDYAVERTLDWFSRFMY